MTIVLIDGRSGSGKTELAKAFVREHPEFQLVQLDSLYPGWDGLAAASADLPRLLTEGTWRSWDWGTNRLGSTQEVDTSRPILVEGAGALTRAAASLADYTVWVELPDALRRHRALARDGETYRPHWERWALQEQAHIDREGPRELADVIVDGANAESALRTLRWPAARP